MSRRSVAILVLAALAVVLGLAPWTVSSDRVRSAVARQIRSEFGLALGIAGDATLMLLPVPRLKLEGVTLADEAGAFSAKAAQFKGELRIASLLLARIRFSEVRITDARIRVVLDGPGQDNWSGVLARLRDRFVGEAAASSKVDRILVEGSELSLVHPEAGRITTWRKLDAAMRWPEAGGDIDLSASASWNGEPVTLALSGITPGQLLSGRSDTVEIRTASRLGRATFVGTVMLRDDPVFSGLLSGQTPSLGALTRWTGWGLDLQDLDRPVSLSGEARLSRDGVEWPQMVLDLGRDRLDGSLAFRLDGGRRPKLRATLAGGDLDLGWLIPIADPTRAAAPRSDYDVRLSASGLRMGSVRLGDLAAGILVNGERLEVSVGRATLAGGSVRGRVSAALDGEGRDIRGQVSIDKVDLESLLSASNAARGLTGTVAGQMTFEALGDGQSDVARHLRGRVALTARDGEIAGIALNEATRRAEPRRGLGLPPGWRGGRTRFGEAQVHLTVADGVAEITDGSIHTAATQTRLRGRISLFDRVISVETTTRTTGSEPAVPAERQPLVLEVRGPIERPVVSAKAADETTGTLEPGP